MFPDKAKQRVKFIDKYRSYVINYDLGRDVVARWVEQGVDSDAQRWTRYKKLLSQPMLPSELTQQVSSWRFQTVLARWIRLRVIWRPVRRGP